VDLGHVVLDQLGAASLVIFRAKIILQGLGFVKRKFEG